MGGFKPWGSQLGEETLGLSPRTPVFASWGPNFSHPSLCPWKAHSHGRTTCVHHVLMALGKMQEAVCSVALLHDPGGQGGWGARLRTRGLICCVSSDKLLALSALQHFSRTMVTAMKEGTSPRAEHTVGLQGTLIPF